jgi:hypothetical protein
MAFRIFLKLILSAFYIILFNLSMNNTGYECAKPDDNIAEYNLIQNLTGPGSNYNKQVIFSKVFQGNS